MASSESPPSTIQKATSLLSKVVPSFTSVPSPLASYKSWVRRHPGLVSNLDWLLYLGVYGPGRQAQEDAGSEWRYEAYHAAIGLLSVWHNHILDEDDQGRSCRPPLALWLDLLEQVETLVELRSMHLEDMGKMSRFGPLAVMEITKACIKMMMWSQCAGHLFLRNPGADDLELIESEQGLQDVASALERLRARYTSLGQCSSDAAADTQGRLHSLASTLLQRVKSLGRKQGKEQEHTQVAWTQSPQQQQGIMRSILDGVVDWSKVPMLGKPHSPSREQSQAGAGVTAAESMPSSMGLNGSTGGGVTSTCEDERCRSHREAESLSEGSLSPPGKRLHQDELMRRGMNLVWLGEMIYIWRPALYCLMLQQHGRRSWRPWVGSLCLELLSTYFTRRGKQLMREAAAQQGSSPSLAQQSGPTAAAVAASAAVKAMRGGAGPGLGPGATVAAAAGGPTSLLSLALVRSLASQQWTPGEEVELHERRRRLLLYLLRPPFLDAFVRGPVESLARGTARVPLLNMATSYAAGLLETLTAYYTYTSGSS